MMNIFYDEFISNLFFAPDYLPDVRQWFKRQPKEGGHISRICLEKILKIISYPCWQRFLQAMESPCELTQEDLTSAEYKLLTETGIANISAVRMPGEKKSRYNLSLPERTKQLLNALDLGKFKRDKLRSGFVHLFAAASVNVYGVIEKETFVRMFNRYMRRPAEEIEPAIRDAFFPLTPDELDSILAPYTELNIDVLLVGDYLSNRMIYNGNPDDITQFLSHVSTDKYYPFSMEELLPYSAPDYFQMTPQIDAFLEEMKEKLPEISEVDLDIVQLIFVPHYLFYWSEIVEDPLCTMLQALSEKEQKEIAELFVTAKRSARGWLLKGFSEDEIFQNGEGREKDVRDFMRVLDG